MDVLNKAIFVKLVEEPGAKKSRVPEKFADLMFVTDRHAIPVFERLWVAVNESTTFIHNGLGLDFSEVIKVLRGYIERPDILHTVLAEESSDTVKALQVLAKPFLEGLWIRVSGKLGAAGIDDDVLVDRARMEGHAGDAPLPITRLSPWEFTIQASRIELDIEVEWNYDHG
jgi:hypothetical protein